MEYKIDSYQKVFIKALNFVSYKPRTEAEVLARVHVYLSREKITTAQKTEIQEKVLEQLKNDGYINDKKILKLYVDSYSTLHKPKSIKRYKQELKQKGISESELGAVLGGLSESAEYEMALSDAKKRQKRFGKLSGFELKAKLSSYLYTKGYPTGTIKSVVDTLMRLQ